MSKRQMLGTQKTKYTIILSQLSQPAAEVSRQGDFTALECVILCGTPKTKPTLTLIAAVKEVQVKLGTPDTNMTPYLECYPKEDSQKLL